jgi:chromosome segregation ATPase
MTDEELIADLRGKGFGVMEKAADRIEQLVASNEYLNSRLENVLAREAETYAEHKEQLEAARADAKEAEDYAEGLEEKLRARTAERNHANDVTDAAIEEVNRLKAKLAKAVEAERARIVKILDGIDRTELDDNGWWETSFGEKFGASVLAAIMKGEGRD